jgi:hypothetical protein
MAVDIPQNPEFGTPGPQIFDSLDQQDVYVTNTETFFNEFKHSFKTGTVMGNLSTAAVADKRKYIDASPALSDDQVEQLNKQNPGLNVPRGTKQNVADLIFDNWKEQRNFERIEQAANPTWGGWLTKEAGAFAGNVADPISLGISAFAPELAGIRRIETATSLADASLLRAQQGFVEGGAFGAAQEGGLKARDNALDQNYDGLAGAINIATNAFLGGVLHPLGGLVKDKLFPEDVRYLSKGFQGVSPEDADQNTETALNQALNGKDVNMEVPLQQAMSNQSKRIFEQLGGETKDFSKLSEAVGEGHDKILGDLNASNDLLEETQNEIKEKGSTPEREENLRSVKKENFDLSDQDRAYQVVKSYLGGEQEDVSPEGFDKYINQMKGPEGSFSHGMGEEELVAPEAPKEIRTLVDETYPKDYQESLKKNVALDDEEKTSIDEIDKDNGRTGKFRRLVRIATDCLSGG